MKREEKSDGKVSWEETGSKIYLTDHAGFFPWFWKLCLYTCCCKGSVPQLEHRWMFFPGPAVVQALLCCICLRAGQATDLGWFHVNLCRANLVISNLYYQACRRHLMDSIKFQQDCVSDARLGWLQHTSSLMAWKRRLCEMWMSKITPGTA